MTNKYVKNSVQMLLFLMFCVKIVKKQVRHRVHALSVKEYNDFV